MTERHHDQSETRDQLAFADEIGIAPIRPDGTLSSFTTIWMVRVGDALYVRSYRGPHGYWYSNAHRTRHGRVRADGIEVDVTFDDATDVSPAAVDEAYRAKYGNSSYVDAMLAAGAAATTLKVTPS